MNYKHPNFSALARDYTESESRKPKKKTIPELLDDMEYGRMVRDELHSQFLPTDSYGDAEPLEREEL